MPLDFRTAFVWLLASPFIGFGGWLVYTATLGWDEHKPRVSHKGGVRLVETKSSGDRLWKGLTGAAVLAVGVGGLILELRKLRSRKTRFADLRRGPVDPVNTLRVRRRSEVVSEEQSDDQSPPSPEADHR